MTRSLVLALPLLSLALLAWPSLAQGDGLPGGPITPSSRSRQVATGDAHGASPTADPDVLSRLATALGSYLGGLLKEDPSLRVGPRFDVVDGAGRVQVELSSPRLQLADAVAPGRPIRLAGLVGQEVDLFAVVEGAASVGPGASRVVPATGAIRDRSDALRFRLQVVADGGYELTLTGADQRAMVSLGLRRVALGGAEGEHLVDVRVRGEIDAPAAAPASAPEARGFVDALGLEARKERIGPPEPRPQDLVTKTFELRGAVHPLGFRPVLRHERIRYGLDGRERRVLVGAELERGDLSFRALVGQGGSGPEARVGVTWTLRR